MINIIYIYILHLYTFIFKLFQYFKWKTNTINYTLIYWQYLYICVYIIYNIIYIVFIYYKCICTLINDSTSQHSESLNPRSFLLQCSLFSDKRFIYWRFSKRIKYCATTVAELCCHLLYQSEATTASSSDTLTTTTATTTTNNNINNNNWT